MVQPGERNVMDQRLLEYELGKIVSVGRGRVGGSGGNMAHHHGPSSRVSSTHTAGTSLDEPRIRVLRAMVQGALKKGT